MVMMQSREIVIQESKKIVMPQAREIQYYYTAEREREMTVWSEEVRQRDEGAVRRLSSGSGKKCASYISNL